MTVRWREDCFEPPPRAGRGRRPRDRRARRARLAHPRRPRRAARRLARPGATGSSSSCSRCAGRCGSSITPSALALGAVRRALAPTAAGSPAGAPTWVATWAGRWALGAGGAVEVGEDPVETLARELQEEWAVEPERLAVEALVVLPNRAGDARRPGVAARRAPRSCATTSTTPTPGGRPTPRAWPDEAEPSLLRLGTLLAGRERVLTLPHAEVPLVHPLGDLPDAADRLARARPRGRRSTCFGWAHGIGWIVMSLLCIAAAAAARHPALARPSWSRSWAASDRSRAASGSWSRTRRDRAAAA